MDNDSPSVKQQLIETLRGAESVVITTKKKPSKDEIAAAIGLHLLFDKLDKVSEVIIASDIPKQLQFLPVKFVNKKLQGQRDFVIEVDQSRTEADHLKYVTEEGKLKIYITPYNGSFSKDDVGFSYGDYHCDAIIGLGVENVNELDDSVTKEQKLTQNTPILLINPGAGKQSSGNTVNWNDPNASSVCEMIMSMSEALGSGLLDATVATALLTGIVDTTQHFTNQATTPKVMTMSAQLLAAGANQAEVIKQLSIKEDPSTTSDLKRHQPDKKSHDKDQQAAVPEPPKRAPNEFQIRRPKPDPAKDSSTSQSTHQESPEVNIRGLQLGASGNSNQAEESKPAVSGANLEVDKHQDKPAAPLGEAKPTPSLPPEPSSPPPPPHSPVHTPTPQNPKPSGVSNSISDQVQSAPVPPPLPHPDESKRERVVEPPAAPPNSQAPDTPAQSNPNTVKPASVNQPSEPPAASDFKANPQSNTQQPSDQSLSADDLEAARRAVEEAHKASDPNQPPAA